MDRRLAVVLSILAVVAVDSRLLAATTRAVSTASEHARGMTIQLSDTPIMPIMTLDMAVFEATIRMPLGKEGVKLARLSERHAIEKSAQIDISAHSRITLTHVTIADYTTVFEGATPIAVLRLKYDGATRTDK